MSEAEKKTITFEFEAPEIMVILKGLDELPRKFAQPLYEKITAYIKKEKSGK